MDTTVRKLKNSNNCLYGRMYVRQSDNYLITIYSFADLYYILRKNTKLIVDFQGGGYTHSPPPYGAALVFRFTFSAINSTFNNAMHF